MDELILRYLSIYMVGIAGIWKAIPVGMALNTTLVETATFTALGSITAVGILYFFGEEVKRRVHKKWSRQKLEKRKTRFSNIMNRYGIVGLGLITPGLFGPITSIVVGLLILPQTSRLMPYLITGIIFWSFLLTWLAASGITLVGSFF